jgi:hypothetical protein
MQPIVGKLPSLTASVSRAKFTEVPSRTPTVLKENFPATPRIFSRYSWVRALTQGFKEPFLLLGKSRGLTFVADAMTERQAAH